MRAKYSLSLKTHGPSERELVEKTSDFFFTNGHNNGSGATHGKPPQRKNKAFLLDKTVVNPRASFNLENTARHRGRHLADAVVRRKTVASGSFPATYSVLPLATSTCGETDPDVHTLIKELAIRRVEHRPDVPSNESLNLAGGTEKARLRQRFPFVLQQAL